MRASPEGTRGGGDRVRSSFFGAGAGESQVKIRWIAEGDCGAVFGADVVFGWLGVGEKSIFETLINVGYLLK